MQMGSFKIGQCLVWLLDRDVKYSFAIISVLTLLSSVQNMQALALGIMASLKMYYEQEMDTWLNKSPSRVEICMF
jgi:hypothetical protein